MNSINNEDTYEFSKKEFLEYTELAFEKKLKEKKKFKEYIKGKKFSNYFKAFCKIVGILTIGGFFGLGYAIFLAHTENYSLSWILYGNLVTVAMTIFLVMAVNWEDD